MNNPNTLIDGETLSLDVYITSLSLANIGEKSFNVNTIDLDKKV